MTEAAGFAIAGGVIVAFISGIGTLCHFVTKNERRERMRYMESPHVIDGVFLPAPNDEEWTYDPEEQVLLLDKVQILHIGGSGFTLKIGDAAVRNISFDYDSNTGSLSCYCTRVYQRHDNLHREHLARERTLAIAEATEKHVADLQALAKASEKHVAGLIE